MKIHCVLAVVLLSLFPMLVQASKERGVYFGGGIELVNVGAEDFFSNSVDFKVGELLLGYKYNGYLGLEVRGGASFSEETVAFSEDEDSGRPVSAEASIKEFYSIYYRLEFENEIAKLYFLLGQSDITTETELVDGRKIEISDSGLSYGVGLGLWVSERMNLNFEIKSLINTSNDSFTSAGFNADFRF